MSETVKIISAVITSHNIIVLVWTVLFGLDRSVQSAFLQRGVTVWTTRTVSKAITIYFCHGRRVLFPQLFISNELRKFLPVCFLSLVLPLAFFYSNDPEWLLYGHFSFSILSSSQYDFFSSCRSFPGTFCHDLFFWGGLLSRLLLNALQKKKLIKHFFI